LAIERLAFYKRLANIGFNSLTFKVLCYTKYSIFGKNSPSYLLLCMYRIERFISKSRIELWELISGMGLLKKHVFFTLVGITIISFSTTAQSKASTDTVPSLTLDQCIVYALQHQPSVLQSEIGITIAKKSNQIALSGWLPQVNAGADFYHYLELPTGFSSNAEGTETPIKTGIYNSLTPNVTASENLFSPGLLYAAKSAHLLVQQAKQASDSSKINTIATVSSSFYSLLNTLEQVNVLKEDTAEFHKSMRDAYHQYKGGIVDKTDYEEAIITLNNAKAQLKQATENVTPEYATLKQQMGFPPASEFNVRFDTAQMMHEIAIDTTQQLQYKNRIEYQLLETAKNLQQQSINYYRYNFLPTLSAFYSYNYEYENNTFSDLLSQAYPYSYVGASLSIPLFTGFARLEGVQRAKLQGQMLELSEVNLQASIYVQYTSALANYKGNIYNLLMQKENEAMSKDVYGVVALQYKQGIVPYLNVITAEDNLVSSEINYINSLFQVLLNKVDLEKAMGNIPPNH
jgi:outer membrane protein TolC